MFDILCILQILSGMEKTEFEKLKTESKNWSHWTNYEQFWYRKKQFLKKRPNNWSVSSSGGYKLTMTEKRYKNLKMPGRI